MALEGTKYITFSRILQEASGSSESASRKPVCDWRINSDVSGEPPAKSDC
jgi:hypothetical protein